MTPPEQAAARQRVRDAYAGLADATIAVTEHVAKHGPARTPALEALNRPRAASTLAVRRAVLDLHQTTQRLSQE